MTSAFSTDVKSQFGLRSITVDGQFLAGTLKLQVKWNSPLHAAYWAAFNMHNFADRPGLALLEQLCCKKADMVRLYCLAKGQQYADLYAIYTQAQIFIREYEITQLRRHPEPTWYEMFLDKIGYETSVADELPF